DQPRAVSRRTADGDAVASRDREFVEFATGVAPRLQRAAYLLCHDWHLAQDLTQTALARAYVAWPRLARAGHPEAYARQILCRTYLDHRRRRSTSELVSDGVPERASRSENGELRLSLLEALRRLSPRDRAVVVLRYWEDQSVEATARALGL